MEAWWALEVRVRICYSFSVGTCLTHLTGLVCFMLSVCVSASRWGVKFIKQGDCGMALTFTVVILLAFLCCFCIIPKVTFGEFTVAGFSYSSYLNP